MISRKLALTALCLTPALSLRAVDSAPDVKLTPLADRVRVEIGGRLFTEYVYGDGASRPYCYPILASDGTAMTRNFPMKKVAGEDTYRHPAGLVYKPGQWADAGGPRDLCALHL